MSFAAAEKSSWHRDRHWRMREYPVVLEIGGCCGFQLVLWEVKELHIVPYTSSFGTMQSWESDRQVREKNIRQVTCIIGLMELQRIITITIVLLWLCSWIIFRSLFTPSVPALFYLLSQQPLRLNYFNKGLLPVMFPRIHSGIPVESWMQYVINLHARVFFCDYIFFFLFI